MKFVSDCCGEPVLVAGRTTRYHVCSSCRKPCDAVPDEDGVDWDAPNQGWVRKSDLTKIYRPAPSAPGGAGEKE